MSNPPEITCLFSLLASQIEAGDTELNKNNNQSEEIDVLITSLNQSLNLGEISRVRVLDTALSLMCFTPSQVYRKPLTANIKTLIEVILL